jgi:hypothetical protein
VAEVGDIEEHVSKLDGETRVKWVYLGSGRWRRLADLVPKQERKGPVAHDPNYFSDGRFKYQTHGRSDRGSQPCIEDLGNDVARETWHDYVVTTGPDGERVEGPAPFKNSAEKAEYMRLYGYREGCRGERNPHPVDQIRSRLEKKWRNR